MNILPGNMRFGAGQPVKRLEDQRLLTGKGLFIDDKPEDGALWLYVLRSPHAHAKIVSIDIKAAADMPGVDRMFVNKWIKQRLCQTTTGNRAWLRKLVPWIGQSSGRGSLEPRIFSTTT